MRATLVDVSEPGTAIHGRLAGIWRSRYAYTSSSRDDEEFTGQHYVLLLQHEVQLQVRALPGSRSQLTMNLSIDGRVATGAWREVTSADGYYHGHEFHGVVQMIVDPAGRRMEGRWLGHDRAVSVINSGAWTLDFIADETDEDAVLRYSRPVDST
jgi:hypothetical protein